MCNWRWCIRCKIVLLDLGRLYLYGAEIGHRGRHHHHISRQCFLGHRSLQLGSSANLDPLNASGSGKSAIGADQDNISAATGSGGCHRKALPPRRSITQEAHRVQRLSRSPRGDHHAATSKVLTRQSGSAKDRDGRGEDLIRLGEPALP